MNLRNQLQLEIKRLPGMLGKLFGGIAAAIGIAGAAVEINSEPLHIFWIYILVTVCGFGVFIRSSIWLNKVKKQQDEKLISPANPQWQVNLLSWGLLFCFVAAFLLAVFVIVYL